MRENINKLPRYHLSDDDSYRSVVWGDMQIGYVSVATPIDCTLVYEDIGGVCDCPHWGYVFEGSISARYPNGEADVETANAGDVYYFPPGHVLSYTENTKALELNHPEQLESLMQRINGKVVELRKKLGLLK